MAGTEPKYPVHETYPLMAFRRSLVTHIEGIMGGKIKTCVSAGDTGDTPVSMTVEYQGKRVEIALKLLGDVEES